MSVAYWDTACVLKLYCREPDSEFYIETLTRSVVPPRASDLLRTEMYFALHQKAVRGETGGRPADDLYANFQEDLKRGHFILYPLGNDVLIEARRICSQCYAHDPMIALRTLDGLHLATAVLADCPKLHTTDGKMLAAAQFLGLEV